MSEQRPQPLIALCLLALLLAAALFVDQVYQAPLPPPEMIWTLKGQVRLHHSVQAGDLLTAPNLGTIYYLNADQERVTFPDEKTFFSWYPDFSGVKTIPLELLQTLALAGRNVTIRPGTYLVTIQSSPQVWMIGQPRTLVWLKGGEEQVQTMFGRDWSRRLIDLPEYFFDNYQLGAEITTTNHYATGQLIHVLANDQYYVAAGDGLRLVTTAGLTANHWQTKFALEVQHPLPLRQSGPPVKDYEPYWGSPDLKEQADDQGPPPLDTQGAQPEVG